MRARSCAVQIAAPPSFLPTRERSEGGLACKLFAYGTDDLLARLGPAHQCFSLARVVQPIK
jgi:hypothetical protein